MFMYCGHDTTIAANLQALEVYSGIKPPFASAVLYEMHNIDDEFYVKVR